MTWVLNQKQTLCLTISPHTAPNVDAAPNLSLTPKQDHLLTVQWRGDSLSVSLEVTMGRPLLQEDTVGWDQTSPSAASSRGFLTGLPVSRAHLHRQDTQCPQD